MEEVILGVDPGLACVGVAVLSSTQGLVMSTTIKTTPKDPLIARVCQVQSYIDHYADMFKPTCMAFESYQNYGRVHWNGVQTLYVIGAFITSARSCRLVSFTAAECKQGTKGKDGIRKLVEQHYGAAKRTQHEIDAIAVCMRALKHLEGV